MNSHLGGTATINPIGLITSNQFSSYLDDNAWSDHAVDGSVTARYRNDASIDGLVARWSPSEGVEWILTDQLRSVRYAVDHGATVNATIGYDSFGNPLFGEADQAGSAVLSAVL